MPPFHLMDPTRLFMELGYTLIVVLLCFLIYYKTREIYDLTKHEGIKYFRMTFLFFGFAFFFRFLSIFFMLMGVTFDIYLSRQIIRVFPLVFNGYFSTMAILSLVYSIIWKQLQIKHIFLIANGIAIAISGIAFFSRSSYLLTLSQAGLMIITLLFAFYVYGKSRKVSRLFILYILLFVFWLANLFALAPRRLFPFEMQTAIQIVSIIVIGIIYHKVAKWTK
jgi:hypothetical protein